MASEAAAAMARRQRKVPGAADAVGRIAVTLFGRVTLRTGDSDRTPRSRKACALLAVLCLAKGGVVSRARLADLLWERSGEAQARASLRQALLELQRAIEPAGGDILLAGRDSIGIDIGRLGLDVARLRLGIAAETLPAPDLPDLPLLADLEGLGPGFDQWLALERSHLEQALRKALEDAIAKTDASQDAPRRAELGLRCLALDPADENAARVRIEALSSLGQMRLALRTYEGWRDAVRRLLDAAPSAAMEALRNSLLRTRPEDATPRAPVVAGADAAMIAIGILPFTTSGSLDPATGMLLATDLAGALARFRRFEVRPLDPGQDLADLVIGGTIANAESEHLALHLHLTRPAPVRRMVWAESVRVPGRDIIGLGARVLHAIAGNLQAVLLHHAARLLEEAGRPATPDAHTTRGIALMATMTRLQFLQAREQFDAALRLDPGNPRATAWQALWHLFRVGQSWSNAPPADVEAARALALAAMRADPFDAETLAIAGHVNAFLCKDFELALDCYRRAEALNPHLPSAWALSGLGLSYTGRPEQAVEHFERYFQTAASDPMFPVLAGCAVVPLLMKGDYERAVAVGRRFVREIPGFTSTYKPLLSACGHLGLEAEASVHLARLLVHEPDYSTERFVNFRLFKHDADAQHYGDGLLRAGVPDGPTAGRRKGGRR